MRLYRETTYAHLVLRWVFFCGKTPSPENGILQQTRIWYTAEDKPKYLTLPNI